MNTNQDDATVAVADENDVDQSASESWVAEQVRLLTLEEGCA
jgi:hypothetical protein